MRCCQDQFPPYVHLVSAWTQKPAGKDSSENPQAQPVCSPGPKGEPLRLTTFTPTSILKIRKLRGERAGHVIQTLETQSVYRSENEGQSQAPLLS